VKSKSVPIWSPPTLGYKLNFDGSSRGNPGPSGIGVVRNVNASVILSLKGPIGDSDAAYAELMALSEGFKQAINFNLLPLVVEGDSADVIHWSQFGRCPWRFVYLIAKIHCWT
jgi:ribonuclease HI